MYNIFTHRHTHTYIYVYTFYAHTHNTYTTLSHQTYPVSTPLTWSLANLEWSSCRSAYPWDGSIRSSLYPERFTFNKHKFYLYFVCEFIFCLLLCCVTSHTHIYFLEQHIHSLAHSHAHTRTHTHTYTYTHEPHIHTYTHTHIHTYTHTPPDNPPVSAPSSPPQHIPIYSHNSQKIHKTHYDSSPSHIPPTPQ